MIAVVVFCAVPQVRHARADAPAVLNAIADTADRLCGIVATRGETDANKIQGEIHAELTGLARRLAKVGGSGATDITSSKYEGVLQQDLPITLKDVRECKLRVFEKLQETLLPGTTQHSGPGIPSTDLLQAPANAVTLDTARSVSQNEELGLYSCTNEPSNITCYVVLSRISPGEQDYRISAIRTDQYKLVDNFHIEHRLRRAFFIDGLGSHQQSTNLSAGESIWLTLEFDPVARPISSARIVFSPYQGAPQLRGPVN